MKCSCELCRKQNEPGMKSIEDVFEEFVSLVGEPDRRLSPDLEFDRICRALDVDQAAMSDYLAENFGFSGPEVVRRCSETP